MKFICKVKIPKQHAHSHPLLVKVDKIKPQVKLAKLANVCDVNLQAKQIHYH